MKFILFVILLSFTSFNLAHATFISPSSGNGSIAISVFKINSSEGFLYDTGFRINDLNSDSIFNLDISTRIVEEFGNSTNQTIESLDLSLLRWNITAGDSRGTFIAAPSRVASTFDSKLIVPRLLNNDINTLNNLIERAFQLDPNVTTLNDRIINNIFGRDISGYFGQTLSFKLFESALEIDPFGIEIYTPGIPANELFTLSAKLNNSGYLLIQPIPLPHAFLLFLPGFLGLIVLAKKRISSFI